MSGSPSSSNGSPYNRSRCLSTAAAGDTNDARAIPRGRDRLAINFLASSGGDPAYPHVSPSGLQNYSRARTTSAHLPPSSRAFVPSSSNLNPGQARVTTSSHFPDPRGRTYHLEVVQHPERSAEFGNTVLSRLPLAPPLIVQLIVRDQSGTVTKADDEIPFLVSHLSLYSGDGSTALDGDSNHPTYGQIPAGRLLYGTLVSSPHNYRNLQGRMGHYFIFPDVSIRSRGLYKLKITLMRLSRVGASGVVGVGEHGGVLATTWTHPFEVISQSNYVAPQLTQLTQYFLQQGARMYAFASSIHTNQSPH